MMWGDSTSALGIRGATGSEKGTVTGGTGWQECLCRRRCTTEISAARQGPGQIKRDRTISYQLRRTLISFT